MPPLVNWTIGPPRKKWQVSMLEERVSLLSNSPIRCSAFADSGGKIVNPLSYTVEFSFTTSDVNPGSWTAGTWDVTNTGNYVAQINPGPSGANLALGEYFVWTRITGGGDVDIQQPGQLVVQ